jgi:hypothetical protein
MEYRHVVFFTGILSEQDKQVIADWILHSLFWTTQTTHEQ